MPLYASAGINASGLWLPRSLSQYQAQLLQAAELALAQEHCQTVLEGTLDREQSTEGKTLYRILCRTSNGTSFNLMIDLERAQVLGRRPELPDESEYASAGDEDVASSAALLLKASETWHACQVALLQSTALMASLKWLQPWPLEPAAADSQTTTYVADFDAVDAERKRLRFRARCSVDADAKAEVELMRRP